LTHLGALDFSAHICWFEMRRWREGGRSAFWLESVWKKINKDECSKGDWLSRKSLSGSGASHFVAKERNQEGGRGPNNHSSAVLAR